MKRLLTLSISFLFCAGLFAQQISLTEQHIPAEGQFAQPYDVRFEINHTPSYTVDLDQKSLPEGFGLSEAHSQITSPETVTYDLTFLPFTLGASTFTAVNFVLKDSAGHVRSYTASRPTSVQISSVKFFNDKKMRDIRPPYVPANWMWLIVAVLALALIIYLIRRSSRHIQESRLLKREIDSRPADVIALEKIQQLLQSGLWEKAQYKLFYTELGDILRTYLWQRFQLDVSADTSVELLRRARTVPALNALYTELRDFLSSSDLVKFAKAVPTEGTMQQDVRHVQTIVETTAPQTPTPTEEKH